MSEHPHEAQEPAVGEVIRRLREQRRLSRGELAVTAGVDEQRLQAIECGRIDADYVLLVRLERALGVSPGTVLTLAEERAGQGGGS